jgi:hypothetical protein
VACGIVTLVAPANAAAPLRPCPAGEESSPAAGKAGFEVAVARTALVFSVLLSGVNRSAMACSAALIFCPSDSLSGARMP